MRAGMLAVTLGMALTLLALSPGMAAAQPLSCGQVIVEDTTLENDLSCAGDGIVIGADGITLDLGGHTVKSLCDADCAGTVGIDNSGGYDRVRILNGSIGRPLPESTFANFEHNIALVGADKNTLEGLRVDRCCDDSGLPIFLSDSNDNRIEHSTVSGGAPAAVELSDSDGNTISRSGIFGGVGPHSSDALWILDGSDNNSLTRSRLNAEWIGIQVFDSTGNRLTRNNLAAFVDVIQLGGAERTLISHNTLESGQGNAIADPWPGTSTSPDSNESVIRHNEAVDGIRISGDRNRVAQNDVSGWTFFEYPGLIHVLGGDGNSITGNTTSILPEYHGDYPWDGILVEPAATHTLIQYNLATGATDDGIDVAAPGTVVRGNTANDNGDLGIEAVAGVIDGGGNQASGNGNPLQCLNVLCR